MFRRNRAAFAGLILFAIILLCVIAGPFLYRVNPFAIVSRPFSQPGFGAAPLGTDYLGRDILAGLLNGGRLDLIVGLGAGTITMSIGVVVGALSGFYGGWVDSVLMRITEFFQVLPPLLLAMTIVSLFSPTVITITLSIGVVSWPPAARLTRGEFMRVRHLDYVQAARSIGAGKNWLIWRVILPNVLPPLIVAATLAAANAILFESGLSFLGLGDPNVMSWGLMMGQNRDYALAAWWTTTMPGVAIFFTVLSISLIGDGLSEAFNVRLRER
ncbi:ABC transporter permease [Acidiphilium sp. AL]|nr:ABC transporter permease [Acidiphilium sp. AL]